MERFAMKRSSWTLFVILTVAAALPSRAWSDARTTPDHGRWSEPVKVTGKVDDKTMTATMLMYLPRGYPAGPAGGAAGSAAARKYPLVLALHGWNHSPEMFRDKGDLARWADTYGLVIAVPAMTTTIYETKLYPQSTRTWGAVPGTRWVGEVILPYVRAHYSVSGDRAHTAVIGYSTGGRGAVLLAEAYPEFSFAGSASGTFDLMRLDPKDGEYKIHAVVYGPRDKFKDRWELDNCVSPARLARLGGTQLFIAHSSKDRSVPPDQLDALRDVIMGNPDIKAEFAVSPEGGHTWEYWNGQWGAMFGAMATAMGVTPTK
jgi:S-formylglutathione hydrolase FrmB